MKDVLRQIVVSILLWESKKALEKMDSKIAVVTGSVGKTSSKDAIATVLAVEHNVRKSEKSYNSDIGVPLTILNLRNAWGSIFGWTYNIIKGFFVSLGLGRHPEWLVLEIGADAPGDIESVSKWLKTDAVVLTRFPNVPVHVEFFGTPEKVIAEKLFLVDSLKRDGALILNYDDKQVMKAQEKVDNNIYSFGFDPGASAWASNYSIFYDNDKPVGITFKVDFNGSSVPVKIFGALGRSHAYSALAGLTVGVSQGINLVSGAEALSHHRVLPGRMTIMDGIKDTTIIDDSYNSSPAASVSALEALDELRVSGRKIAILGDMAELGTYSEKAHKDIGSLASQKLDILVTVGDDARFIALGALESGMSEKVIYQFDDAREAGKFIETKIQKGDVVLVKGSQRVRAEKAVEEIMLHPEKKKKLLVRQEREWKNR